MAKLMMLDPDHLDGLDDLFEDDGSAGLLFRAGDEEPSPFMEAPSSFMEAPSSVPTAPTSSSSSPMSGLAAAAPCPTLPSLVQFQPQEHWQHVPAAPDHRGCEADEVSTQSLTESLSPADLELQEELEDLLEQELQREQNIDNAVTETPLNHGDQVCHSVEDTPALALPANPAATVSEQRPPPTSVVDQATAEQLAETIFLNAAVKLTTVYSRLGLHAVEGKELWIAAKDYFRSQVLFRALSRQDDRDNGKRTKIYLIQTAAILLDNHGWGSKAFGNAAEGSPSIRLFSWPADRTEIIVNLVALLYRALRNEQQRRFSGLHRTSRKDRHRFERSSSVCTSLSQLSASPVSDATVETWDMSSMASGPSTAHLCLSPSQFGMGLPTYSSPHAALPLPGSASVTRYTPITVQTNEVVVISDSEDAPQQATAVSLVKHREMPDMVFNVDIVRNGIRLQPRLRLNSSTSIFLCGYTMLLERCNRFGAAAAVKILTPNGLKLVTNDNDWVFALREIAEEEIMDGVVKVRIDVT